MRMPKKEKRVTKATVVEPRYAGFWIRFLASIIDSAILSFGIGLILGVAITLAMVLSGPGEDLSLSGLFVLLCAYALIIAGSISYHVLLTKKYGATLGKMVLGLVVVTESGQPLSWGDVVLREVLGKIVSGFFFDLGYIMAGFTERKQALHDYIAHTYVTYK